MEIRLGYITHNGQNPTINFLDEISQEQFDKINEAIKVLSKYSFNKNLFTILSINVNEFFDTLPVMLQSCIHSVGELQLKNIHLNINRLYINLLSSFRAYLDHTETYLKKKYGHSSAEYNSFKQITSSLYDNEFAYRFAYKLRNYSQHCGFPIESISFKSSEDELTKQKTHFLKIDFLRDELVRNYDGWGIVKNDILNEPSEMDAEFLTYKLYTCIYSLSKKIEFIDKPSIKNAISIIQKFIDLVKVGTEDARVCIFNNIKVDKDGHVASFSTLDLTEALVAHFNDIDVIEENG